VATQGNISAFSGFATTGDSDASPDNQASQYLLFRNLEPGVTEELLAKAMTKLYRVKGTTTPPEAQGNKKPKMMSTSTDANLGAKEGSLMRVFLVRDRKTNESWRYGFAEFGCVEDAQAAMAKYNSSEKFTISSKPVLASYIHAGVFVPVLQAPSPEFEKFTFSPLSNPSMKLMYWDEGAFASELTVARETLPDAAKLKEKIRAKLAAAAAGEGLLDTQKGF
jgi:RNA recognition motif-containing protein